MKIIKTIKQVRQIIALQKKQGKRIGFVPTMGALHEGHLSLIRMAKKHSDFVVVSIFVNPTQFGPKEDYKKYPRNLKKDAALCQTAGADLIFSPSPEEIYPKGFSTYIDVEGLTQGLCGVSRPGHFRGVATVVAKLFNIVQPDAAVFGQKDAQQLAVIRRMTADLDLPVKIIGAPIVREGDGLAMSSRNAYLTLEERAEAPTLYRALLKAKALADSGQRTAGRIKGEIKKILYRDAPLAEIDYIEIVDNETLKPVKQIKKNTLIALAVKLPNARLIDNLVIK
ncbi:MAG: pantoate--beta-alanine ligase [Candidatus Edwardsbacteria bacterium RIFOXYD12_FULL_50_11]|uniref:Pantothenate synthetase n=1 Tax=Candidatus Edwardsbacteria bacterium GWF2_54_11 TaxID=1817851 RepID=A0A1F5REQ2_9BACT|nr:MAG: pantoate--beta-alanine ligase [Candidatus Edwardsbacteria bacterium RifOxyC12_full_54_24]OGF09050.1 MAG: pantoate--beta-alanine ligase [Candidatus Edwardsbacteria bacterium RifOxyA12_full_54_48]OGF12937.1 MAG: pantoate--beta-alanine ligase [Candidatus Edwardsbacteria bacterium GWF2_54_11]OGF17471.1 MAG: pantoate--beta-alanine ligase [Candidatus Edwardsbacteria bacterium RIFOXYD12_FULL_50_11]OGJ17750.1 MAG: pantoate--beta-alanine ligase [Candidatus Edwardsbacteria bacterium RifOxyB12_ful